MKLIILIIAVLSVFTSCTSKSKEFVLTYKTVRVKQLLGDGVGGLYLGSTTSITKVDSLLQVGDTIAIGNAPYVIVK